MDFEQVQWLNFTIRAQDHGTPPRMAELPVYLRIVDVNDNNPFFLQPSYQVLNRVLRRKKGSRITQKMLSKWNRIDPLN